MSRLSRVFQKVFAGSASNNGQFGSAQLGTFNITSSIADIQALAAWVDGWNDAVISGQRLPCLEELQGIQYVITTQLAYLFQQGIPEYDASTTYYIGSLVISPGTTKLYKSLIDNNTGNALTVGADWRYCGDLSTLLGAPFWCSTSTGSANAQVISTGTSLAAFVTGQAFSFIAGYSNSTDATLTVDSVSATHIYANSAAGLVVLVAGQLIAGNVYTVIWNGTNLVLRASPVLGTIASLASNQACKAWVRFAGASGTIASAFNVSSVTRNAMGDYTANFTNSIGSTNYAVVCTTSDDLSAVTGAMNVYPAALGGTDPTATTVRVVATANGAGVDGAVNSIVVFGT